MNRTERAIKRQLRKIQFDKKFEKRELLWEIKDSCSFYPTVDSSALKEAVTDEKKLKEWHRKIMSDQKLKKQNKEALTA